jgi:hypothetical protein
VDLLSVGEVPPPDERLSLREAAPQLPLAFVQVVERAMEFDPARRIPGVGEMEQALAAALNMGRPSGPVRPRWRRIEILTPFVAVAALALWLLLRPAGPPGGLPVDARLFAGLAQGAARPVSPGEAVRVGERLFLDVKTAGDTWVYVATEDSEGRVHTLFPAADLDTQNPLRGARVHRLPGTARGAPKNWRVDTAGGRETILVVASRVRLEALEGELANLPAASADGTPDGDLARRGVGELVDAPEGGMIPALEALAREAAPDPEGLWTRRFEFTSDAAASAEGVSP